MLDAQAVEVFLRSARSGERQVRLLAIETLALLPLSTDALRELASAAVQFISSLPRTDPDYVHAISICAQIPVRSVRISLGMAGNPESTSDLAMRLLARIGRPGEVIERLACLPLEHLQVTGEHFTNALSDPNPDVRFWAAIAVARIGDLKPLDAILQGLLSGEGDTEEGNREYLAIFTGNPWDSYNALAAARPLPPQMHAFLVGRYYQELKRVGKQHINDLARDALQLIGGLTGIVDAEGYPQDGPREVPPPLRQPADPVLIDDIFRRLSESPFDEHLDINVADDGERNLVASLTPERAGMIMMSAFDVLENRAQERGVGVDAMLGNYMLDLAVKLPDRPVLPLGELVRTRGQRWETRQFSWLLSRAGAERLVDELGPHIIAAAEPQREFYLSWARNIASQLNAGPPYAGPRAGPSVRESQLPTTGVLDDLVETYVTEAPPLTRPEEAPKPPLARYSNLRVFEAENSDRRDEVLDRPLIAGHRYYLEVSIGLEPAGIPVVGKVEEIRRLNTRHPVDLFVVVAPGDEAEWEIFDPIQSLKLPPAKPTDDPATFILKPTSGQPAKRRNLLVKIYYRLNLIDSLVFAPFVVPADEKDSRQQDHKPPLFLAVDGFPERYAEIDPDLAPKKLNIALKRTGAIDWRLTAVLEVNGKEIPLVGYAILSDADMQQIVTETRTAWDSLVTDDRLDDSAQRPAAFAQALARLADAGSNAWNSLVGAGGTAQSLYSIGRMLEDNPPVEGASVQIICEERGVDFIFPWTILYAAPYSAGQQPGIKNFWGFRYDIEIRNLQVLGRRSLTPTCKIGYALWRSQVAARQGAMLSKLAATRPNVINVTEPAIESRDAFFATLKDDGLDVLYVFAHGYTRTPGLGGLAALKAWLTAKLTRAAATPANVFPEELAVLRDNLAEIDRDNKDDWIKLTKSTLTFSELQKLRDRLNRKPLVFLNMCHSAQINPGLSSGFVSYFLQRGACAVIGTECPVPPFFAEVFAEEVFQRLAKGKSVGAAVYAARTSCSKAENPLALAYSLYGYADSRIVKPPTKAFVS